jgi:hypothetical protein
MLLPPGPARRSAPTPGRADVGYSTVASVVWSTASGPVSSTSGTTDSTDSTDVTPGPSQAQDDTTEADGWFGAAETPEPPRFRTRSRSRSSTSRSSKSRSKSRKSGSTSRSKSGSSSRSGSRSSASPSGSAAPLAGADAAAGTGPQTTPGEATRAPDPASSGPTLRLDPPETTRASWAADSANANLITFALAAVAAVGAALAGGHPTIYPGLDLLLRAAFGAGVTLATAYARRWSWLVLAGIAAGASRDVVSAVPAWAALALAFAAVIFDFRRRWIGAVVGLLATTALLRLAPIGPHGFTTVLTAIAVVPVAVSAYQRQRRATRRLIRRIGYGVGGVVGVALLGLVLAVRAGSRERQLRHRRGPSRCAVRSPVTTRPPRRTSSKPSTSFASGTAALNAWYAKPALVPVVSFQAGALGQMAATADDLAQTAQTTAAKANYRAVDVRDGAIATDRITALGPPLREVQTALERAQRDTDTIETAWLAPPLREKFEDLRQEVHETNAETATAIDAIDVAPAMLGADGPRYYFVAFTTPSESRGLGGFMGNWAELKAENGKLELTQTGRSAELNPGRGDPRGASTPLRTTSRGTAPCAPRPRCATSPSPPTSPRSPGRSSRCTRRPASGGPSTASSRSTPTRWPRCSRSRARSRSRASRPRSPPTTPPTSCCASSTSTSTSATRAWTSSRKRPARRSTPSSTRSRCARRSSRRCWGRWCSSGACSPSSTMPEEESLLTRLGLAGAFPAHDQGDFFSVVTQNGGNNKMDVFLTRDITYHATVNPTNGDLDAVATIALHNDAPSSGLPAIVISNRESSNQPDGVNWSWVNFYTPHQLEQATIDGQPLVMGSQTEFGLHVYHAYVAVPSKGDAKIELRLKGSVAPGANYDVTWYQQPTVNVDHVHVSVTPQAPWTVSSTRSATGDRAQALISVEPRTQESFAVEFERQSGLRPDRERAGQGGSTDRAHANTNTARMVAFVPRLCYILRNP